jgi:probable rRNA maturation factor
MPRPTPHQSASEPERDSDQPRTGIVVDITDTQGFLRVDHDALTRLAIRVLQAEGLSHASLSIALVDDAAIHRVNRVHLQHDCPTDVISFLLSEPDSHELVGELVVSAQTAQATASDLGVPAGEELALYVVHGLLHLCGYDDATDKDIQLMRAREQLALSREGLASQSFLAERGPGLGEGEEKMM